MAMISAKDAAAYLLSKQDQEEPDISNLKLLKLLYYAQGVSLAMNRVPLFAEPLEAWKHGPVVASVYHEYKKYGNGPIPCVRSPEIPERDRAALELAYGRWGQYSASALRTKTHNEAPWSEAFNGRGERALLDDNLILQLFCEELSIRPLGQVEFNERFAKGTRIS